MFTLLDELNQCIKEDARYKAYMDSKQLLNKDEVYALLMKYQDVTHKYFEMRKYEKYTDISSIKKDYLKMKKEISENKDIQEYYLRYYELNNLLDDITKIVFSDISDELSFHDYSL